MIGETLPKSVASKFVPINMFFEASGYMLCMGSGVLLPPEDYVPETPIDPSLADGTYSTVDILKNKAAYDANVADENWRLIYFFPVIVNALGLLGYFCLIRADPIMFSLRTGKDEEAKTLIKKVYQSTENPDEILEELKKDVAPPAAHEEGWCEHVWGKKNRHGTLVCLTETEFVQLSGQNILNMFSVRIFSEMNKLVPEELKVSANWATVVIGVSGFIAVMTSFFVVNKAGRMTLFGCG